MCASLAPERLDGFCSYSESKEFIKNPCSAFMNSSQNEFLPKKEAILSNSAVPILVEI
jgi:hypothetical protein